MRKEVNRAEEQGQFGSSNLDIGEYVGKPWQKKMGLVQVGGYQGVDMRAGIERNRFWISCKRRNDGI